VAGRIVEPAGGGNEGAISRGVRWRVDGRVGQSGDIAAAETFLLSYMVDYRTDKIRYVDRGFLAKVHSPLNGVVWQITSKE
jgi:hypothetical protein